MDESDDQIHFNNTLKTSISKIFWNSSKKSISLSVFISVIIVVSLEGQQ